MEVSLSEWSIPVIIIRQKYLITEVNTCMLLSYIVLWVFLVWCVKITNHDHEAKFTQMLTSLLDEHKDVVSMLADGFYHSRDYIQVSINWLSALLKACILVSRHLRTIFSKSWFCSLIAKSWEKSKVIITLANQSLSILKLTILFLNNYTCVLALFLRQ